MSRWDAAETWQVDEHEVLATGRVCDFVNDTITTPAGERIQRQYTTHPSAVGIIALDAVSYTHLTLPTIYSV